MAHHGATGAGIVVALASSPGAVVMAPAFDSGDFLGLPLGLFSRRLGLLASRAHLLAFWFARRQEAIDQRHGLYEN